MQFPVTENLKKAIDLAQNIAAKYSNPAVGSEHLLYGLAATPGSLAAKFLQEGGIKPQEMLEIFENSDHVSLYGGAEFSDRVKLTLRNASKLSSTLGQSAMGSEHVLYCMLQDSGSVAYAILSSMFKIDVNLLFSKLKAALESGRTDDSLQDGNVGGSATSATIPSQLKDLGVDMTQRAREHKIDPIIGRKDEIERIIQILCRKTKNNPVLIGEPGVGKSAVIEGLSKAIVEGNVPELLKDKIVFSLDIGSIMAGTKYRGSLEEKLKNAIQIVMEQGNIILFIDELHTLAQAGGKEGEVSPSDILKPYLARGELQTIGATTTDEYRKFIEADRALERRFQPIIVAPPSVEDTIEILRGLRENYEAFHKVKVSDEALIAAAKLSDRYIMDRFLPDKAIDLIDEAMSKAKVSGNFAPPKLKEKEEEFKNLELLQREAASKEDYALARELRDKKTAVSKEIEDIKMSWSKDNERQQDSISEEDIAQVVAKWTKIPVTKLTETEAQRLVGLENILHKRVIGQNAAVISVAKSIRRARAGLKDPNRPIGTFLFLGPTGVGKTELTKALGESMFDDENSVIRLDMSEYMEAHSVSKLIGAPPGYVGFDDGGQLTEQVRRKPYSVVLFDEIEKAHSDVYNALLQILDDGRLTDSQGRVVNFKNTIIIMTSNVGVGDLKNVRKNLGFATADEADMDEKRTDEVLSEALKRHFKPEFLNRIDCICMFHHLTRDDIAKISELMLKRVVTSLQEKNITLSLTKGAVDYVIEKGYDPEYGARPLRRVIEQTIEDHIAEALLSGEIRAGSKVTVDIQDGKVRFV